MEPGDLEILTEDEVAGAARVAMAAMFAVPTDPCAVAGCPSVDTGPNGIYNPGNLVPRHARIIEVGPMPFFDEGIAVADTASGHLQAHCTWHRLGNRPFGNRKIASRLG